MVFDQVHYAVSTRTILKSLSFTFTEHRIALIGANGSGKSSLIRMINGLLSPSSGQVTVDGLDVAQAGREVRGRVGFLFQNPDVQILMPTPVEDVAFGLKGRIKSAKDRKTKALEVLERMGLGPLADSPAHTLSGGEKQRLALAGVLATDPSLLVMDEPTTMLDLLGQRLFTQLLADLPQRVILTTHSMSLAAQCDRVVWLKSTTNGAEIAADGAPEAVITAYRDWVDQAAHGDPA